MMKLLWMQKISKQYLNLLKERGDKVITYDELLIEADNNGLLTKEKPLNAYKGRIKGKRIAIKRDLPENEKKCVLAEELGHYYTAMGDILEQYSISNRKQEMRGRIFAYNRLVGLTGIINAYKHHCQNLTDAAEYLNVPEEFLNEALSYYKGKYGSYYKLDNYMIIFEPSIAVIEIV